LDVKDSVCIKQIEEINLCVHYMVLIKLKFKRKLFLLLEPNPETFLFSLAFDAVKQFIK